MLQLGIDASTPALVTGTNQLTLTTASFTPPAGSTIVCMGAANSNNAHDLNTPTATGQTAAFVAAPGNYRVQEAPVGIWVLANAISVATTVTLTRTNVGVLNGFALYVPVVAGAERAWGGATATVNSNSGVPSTTITARRRGSLLLAVSSDWSAAGLGTVGVAQTMLQEQHIASQYSSHFWRKNLWAPGGIHTLNLTAPAAEDYNLAVVEIRPLVVARAARARRQR